ncbi:MAG: DUF1302 family protein [Candidatus Binatia bacterium]|nr:DUF1302 family protein [Candidatus Binatia bacterium]
MASPIGRGALALTILLGASGTAFALEFGPNEAFTLRGRFYTQFSIATEKSKKESNGTALNQAGAVPSRNGGDMIQHRNFMNPEFEVDFRRLAKPVKKWIDEFEGRVALWGFYDGLYDYGPDRWRTVLSQYGDHELQQVSKGTQISRAADGTVEFPGGVYERQARRTYGRRIRVNEAYVDLANGPWFLRIGRQAISWGEADTIGLLDANNPFDVTIQPGLMIDLDEARIPLWTIRGTYELFDVMGPLSSAFLEAYWVPGWLDTTISPLVIQSGSPFAQQPPASKGYASPGVSGAALHIFQQLPQPSTANSRWGVKLQTVIDRDYNLQAWFYTTFPIQPVPVVYGLDSQKQITTALKNKLTNVIGGAVSWYSDMLNSIVRTEVELFNGEPGFLAFKNIGQAQASGFQKRGHYDRLNILRGEFGLDYNFFVPALNPTSSILLVGSIVWFWNTDETSSKDYRALGILKPSAIRREQEGGDSAGFYNGKFCDNPNDPSIPETQRKCDFVNQDPVGGFAQVTLRSDFMHGTLTPQLTTIGTHRGSLTFSPSVVYRFSDTLLFDFKYVTTHTFGSLNNGYSIGPGLLRDRDEAWIRATYQIN